ncbi:MAG: hypothetical protein ACPL7I_00325 [Myxococcota bacterium]
MKIFSIFITFVMICLTGIILAYGDEKPSQTSEESKSGRVIEGEVVNKVSPPVENKSPSDISQNPQNEANKGDDKKIENQQEGEAEGKKLNEDKKSEQKRSSDFEYMKYNSFGLNASSHSGIGLSYRYHLPLPILFQITGGVASEGESFYYSVGGEVQRELSKSKDKRAFGSLAIGLYGERYKENDYDATYYTGMEPPKRWKADNTISFAIGVGGELALGNAVVDSLSLGCEIYPIGIYITDSEESNFHMFPGAALYLFYNF